MEWTERGVVGALQLEAAGARARVFQASVTTVLYHMTSPRRPTPTKTGTGTKTRPVRPLLTLEGQGQGQVVLAPSRWYGITVYVVLAYLDPFGLGTDGRGRETRRGEGGREGKG